MNKLFPALGLAASVSAIALAPTASAIYVQPYDSENIAVISAAQFVHDAPSAGYTSVGECESSAVSYINSFIPAQSITESTIGHPASVGCWKGANGRYTYGSIPFSSKTGKMPAAAGALHKMTSVSNVKIHGSGHYSTLNQCLSTKQSIADSLTANGGRMLSAGNCLWIMPTSSAAPYYSYGALTYTTPTYKVTSDDHTTDGQWANVIRYWKGVAYVLAD